MDDTSGAWWAFIDWHKDLNKQAAAHAILIYAMKRALGLARAVNDEKRAHFPRQQNQADEKSRGGISVGRETAILCQWRGTSDLMGQSGLDGPG